MKKRKVPLRKCVGCQEMKNKKEMIRVVRNQEGEISLDFTGKKPGRGIYLSKAGVPQKEEHGGLERSLKLSFQKVYQTLQGISS